MTETLSHNGAQQLPKVDSFWSGPAGAEIFGTVTSEQTLERKQYLDDIGRTLHNQARSQGQVGLWTPLKGPLVKDLQLSCN